MLTHPTEQRLIALGLSGMAKALEEQRRQPDIAALAFEERLGLMVSSDLDLVCCEFLADGDQGDL